MPDGPVVMGESWENLENFYRFWISCYLVCRNKSPPVARREVPETLNPKPSTLNRGSFFLRLSALTIRVFQPMLTQTGDQMRAKSNFQSESAPNKAPNLSR